VINPFLANSKLVVAGNLDMQAPAKHQKFVAHVLGVQAHKVLQAFGPGTLPAALRAVLVLAPLWARISCWSCH
jgi:hypothetical protein